MLRSNKRRSAGFTLLEITASIGVILALAAVSAISANQYMEYRDAREAGEVLRSVRNAQRMFLADHPLKTVEDFTEDTLIRKYMPNERWEPEEMLPKVDGETPMIVTDEYPPYAVLGGSRYDPLKGEKDGGKHRDGLWDSGL